MRSEWLGKRVKVIFDDGRIINSKIGILINQTDELVYIRLDDNTEEAIPFRRIVRIELLEVNSND